MKSSNYAFLRVVAALIIGLVLVLFPDQASVYLVITIGIVFLIPSLIGLIGYFVRDAKKRGRFPIEGVGSFLLGLWLLIMPEFFANLLTLALGAILVLAGIQQIVSLSVARHWVKIPMGFYVIPSLLLLAGIFTLFNPTGVRSTALIIIGIGALLYAATELLHWFLFIRRRPDPVSTTIAAAKASDDVEDAHIIEE